MKSLALLAITILVPVYSASADLSSLLSKDCDKAEALVIGVSSEKRAEILEELQHALTPIVEFDPQPLAAPLSVVGSEQTRLGLGSTNGQPLSLSGFSTREKWNEKSCALRIVQKIPAASISFARTVLSLLSKEHVPESIRDDGDRTILILGKSISGGDLSEEDLLSFFQYLDGPGRGAATNLLLLLPRNKVIQGIGRALKEKSEQSGVTELIHTLGITWWEIEPVVKTLEELPDREARLINLCKVLPTSDGKTELLVSLIGSTQLDIRKAVLVILKSEVLAKTDPGEDSSRSITNALLPIITSDDGELARDATEILSKLQKPPRTTENHFLKVLSDNSIATNIRIRGLGVLKNAQFRTDATFRVVSDILRHTTSDDIISPLVEVIPEIAPSNDEGVLTLFPLLNRGKKPALTEAVQISVLKSLLKLLPTKAGERVLGQVIGLLNSKDESVRLLAVETLGKMEGRGSDEAIKLLQSSDSKIKSHAALVLSGALSSKQAKAVLESAAASKDWAIKATLVKKLVGSAGLLSQKLINLAKSKSYDDRAIATILLSVAGGKNIDLSSVAKLVADKNCDAVPLIGELKDISFIPTGEIQSKIRSCLDEGQGDHVALWRTLLSLHPLEDGSVDTLATEIKGDGANEELKVITLTALGDRLRKKISNEDAGKIFAAMSEIDLEKFKDGRGDEFLGRGEVRTALQANLTNGTLSQSTRCISGYLLLRKFSEDDLEIVGASLGQIMNLQCSTELSGLNIGAVLLESLQKASLPKAPLLARVAAIAAGDSPLVRGYLTTHLQDPALPLRYESVVGLARFYSETEEGALVKGLGEIIESRLNTRLCNEYPTENLQALIRKVKESAQNELQKNMIKHIERCWASNS